MQETCNARSPDICGPRPIHRALAGDIPLPLFWTAIWNLYARLPIVSIVISFLEFFG